MSTCGARKRAIVYVDGFNLHYGALKNTFFKWLNLQEYFTRLRPNDEIQAIRYFTASIDGPHRPNQETYLKALETLPLQLLRLAQFPPQIPDGSGGVIVKPASW